MKAADLVIAEVKRKREKGQKVQTPHEGYALILEELDELWELVREKKSAHAKNKTKKKMLLEAKQIAARAIMFMQDVC